MGDRAELRELAGRTAEGVRERARLGAARAGRRVAGADPATPWASTREAAPVISMARHARTGWRLASAARRHRRPIGLAVAVAAALAVALAVRRWRQETR